MEGGRLLKCRESIFLCRLCCSRILHLFHQMSESLDEQLLAGPLYLQTEQLREQRVNRIRRSRRRRVALFWVCCFVPQAVFVTAGLLLLSFIPHGIKGACDLSPSMNSSLIGTCQCSGTGTCCYQYFKHVTVIIPRRGVFASRRVFYWHGINPMCYRAETDCANHLPSRVRANFCFEDNEDARGPLFVYPDAPAQSTEDEDGLLFIGFLVIAIFELIWLCCMFELSENGSSLQRSD
jgi:hypothetical protein